MMKTCVMILTLTSASLFSTAHFAQESGGDEISLAELGVALKQAVAAGELTEEDAIAKYNEAAAQRTETGNGDQEIKGDLTEFIGLLKRFVTEGRLSESDARQLYESVASPDLNAETSDADQGSRTDLPMTSTGNDREGPDSTFIFGWAADATHRFMDNSHRGNPREIRGLSFRLDYRDHNAIGRTWENVTVRIAHGDFSSIDYNNSVEFRLVDEPVKVFDQPWRFPALQGYPPLEPASWGGPQNCLNFQFDQAWEYNGEDAIFVEFLFSGGTADDGSEWAGIELPYKFAYFLDSMPERGGWRHAEKSLEQVVNSSGARVEAVTSYTAGGQSVWTSAAKGMPFIRWDE